MSKRKENILSVVILVAGLLISGTVMAQSLSNLNYPIPELGNCGSQAECKAYCDEPAHQEECLEFAEENEIMSGEEVERARTMSQVIVQGNGPGGCQTETECKVYCESNAHMVECVTFAEKYNLLEREELQKMKEMVEAVQRGVQFPGNCETKEECEAYCDGIAHIDECLNFAEEAGFSPPGGIEKARQIAALMKLGETPGGCQVKAECDAYCENEAHMEECIEFAVKTGRMTEAEAEMAGKIGRKGPGGCQSEEECDAYCNNPAHQQECFEFAKENGLLSEEDAKRLEEDIARMRAGIEEASPKAIRCINRELGEDVVQKIKSGNFIPSPQIGEKMRECMEQHEQEMQQEMIKVLEEAPQEVITCLKGKLGEEGFNSLKSGEFPDSFEKGEAINSCFEMIAGMEEEGMQEAMNELKQALGNASPELINCLNQVRSNFAERVRSGEYMPTPKEDEQIMKCFETFAPQAIPDVSGQQQQSQKKTDEEIIEGFINEMPAEAGDCIKNNITQSIIEKMKRGEKPGTEFEKLMEKCVGPMQMDKEQPPEGMEKSLEGEMPPKDMMTPEDMKKMPPEDVVTDDMTIDAGPVDSNNKNGGEEGVVCCKKIINGKAQYHWDPEDVCLNPESIAGVVVNDDICLALGDAINKEDEVITEGVPEECVSQGVFDRESCDAIMKKVPICCKKTINGEIIYEWTPGDICISPDKERVDNNFCPN